MSELECVFCCEPAITVSFGFAICGGRESAPINCSERARNLFRRTIAEVVLDGERPDRLPPS